MKNVRMFAAALSMAWLTAQAFSPEVDLKGSIAVGEGQCPYEDMTYKCFLLKKEDKLYIAAVDGQGVLIVYQVSELKKDYTEADVTLLWRRSGRRKDDRV